MSKLIHFASTVDTKDLPTGCNYNLLSIINIYTDRKWFHQNLFDISSLTLVEQNSLHASSNLFQLLHTHFPQHVITTFTSCQISFAFHFTNRSKLFLAYCLFSEAVLNRYIHIIYEMHLWQAISFIKLQSIAFFKQWQFTDLFTCPGAVFIKHLKWTQEIS